MTLRVLRAVTCALLIQACGGAPDRSGPRSTPWFSDTKSLDLTGDGTPETASLEAIGPSVERLAILFTIRAGGDTVYRESWQSSYELSALTDMGRHPLPSPDSALRAHLQTFLTRLRVEPLDRRPLERPWQEKIDDCSEDPRNCIALELLGDSARSPSPIPLFDTVAVQAIIVDMLAAAVPAVSYHYGYETSVTVAWSPLKRRFFTLYACC